MENACRDCRFWDSIYELGRVSEPKHLAAYWADILGDPGRCRRYPPSFNPGVPPVAEEDVDGEYEDWMSARHPVTGAEDWCGEWRERPAPT